MTYKKNFVSMGLWVITAMLIFSPFLYSQNITYYVDSNGGSDANNGTDISTPWQTLTNVNAKTFKPGDKILLKSGSVWSGQLSPGGSGTLGSPITVDMYGGSVKPRIDGGGTVTTGVVYLLNQEYWEINNLEITNNAAAQAYNRRGVLISVSIADSVIHHVYLKNLWVHDVLGSLGSGDADVSAKRTGGIGIESTADGGRYDSVWVDGCEIDSVVETGLWIYNSTYSASSNYPVSTNASWYKNRITNLRITNNQIHHVAKNAMIIRMDDSGLIEHNVCYETALQTTGNIMYTASCNGTLFQYNEGYDNRSTGADGSMYDADLRSPNVIFQYSYSHDNAHGLFWTCTDQQDSGVICRYNISQNDKGNIFCINYPNTSVYCYNNTVYCGSGVSPVIISERNVNSGTRKYYFYNNIIYDSSNSASYQYTNSGYTRNIDYNLYYGNHPSGEPSDGHKLTADPLLVNPGSGGTGISTVNGYRIVASSPAKGSGYLMSNHCSQDFWGNAVTSPVDRGANQATITVPSVTTSTVTAISSTSAICGGTVTSDGGATVTARGICYSTSANPTISGSHTSDSSGTGAFTSSMTGLNVATLYHVRAYATNSLGTVYGGDSTFTTSALQSAPTVTTASLSNITTSSATCGGAISDSGGAAITARGVCWSTSANPSITDNHTNDGTGFGSFISSLTGLNAATTYHVRAYASNSAGTGYGTDVILVTSSWSLQVLGSYPEMDGGFEGQTIGATTSLNTVTTSAVWTNVGGTPGNTGAIYSTGGRSGPKYASLTMTSSGTAHRKFQSPTTTASGAIVSSSSYTVQFYWRRHSGTTTTTFNIRGGVSSSGSLGTLYAAYTPLNSDTWTLYQGTVTTTSAAAAYGEGIISLQANSNSSGGADYEDFCVYAGSIDTTAPNSPGSFTVTGTTNTSISLSWSAPAGGVDGGGYMIVRGKSDPALTPNVRGIYAVGNTIPNESGGTGSGLVVALTTSTSYTDTVSTAGTYYYRIYAVDKAFNYSTAQSLYATAGSITPTVQCSNIGFSSVTRSSMTVSWTRGNGTTIAVFMKEGAGAIINPSNGTAYTASANWNNNNSAGSQLSSSGYYCVYNGSGSSVGLTNLNLGSTYYIYAYEYNGSGGNILYQTNNPASGNQTTQAASTATVITNTVSNIGGTTAVCGGNVTDNGGYAVTARGVCWSSSQNPTTADSHTGDSSGTGTFSSSLTGLSYGTIYHVRAYAVTFMGTAYGGDTVFQTATSTVSDSLYWALTANQSCVSGSHINGTSQVLSSGGSALSMSVKDYNAGTTNGGERLNLGSTSWPNETKQNDSRYIEFSLTPAAQYDYTVSSVSFSTGYSGGSTAHMFANVYYSLDSWATRKKLNTDSIVVLTGSWNSPTPTFSTNVFVPNGSTMSVRIYPWYNSTPSTTRYISLKNFTVSGTSSLNSAYLKGSVNVKVIQQGFYNSGDKLNCSDTIKVLLAHASSPYSYADSTLAILDSTTFTAAATLSNAASGNYYVVIKHRNSIETWSANPVAFIKGSTVSYDFTDAQSKAYGNNQVKVSTSPERWAIYSGDVNQDGYVDPLDLALIDNDSYNYVSGNALATDLNGDRYTDPLDLAIADNNSFNYVGIQRPAAYKVISSRERAKLLQVKFDLLTHPKNLLKK